MGVALHRHVSLGKRQQLDVWSSKEDSTLRRSLRTVSEFWDTMRACIRLAPYLFTVRKQTELRPILRSYLRWMPLCLFSEPVLWLRMLLHTKHRFQTEFQQSLSFYAPRLQTFSFAPEDLISQHLEAYVAVIQEEFNRIAPPEVTSPSHALVDTGAWHTFPLMRAAQEIKENIALFPATWAVVEQCPLLRGVRGGVYFSIVYPGTHIRSHCGPSNLKLRYHLTIEEASEARIRSGREWRSWAEGKCLILDDSMEHEVVHTGNDRRVVFIVDCWHPGLSADERTFLTHLHQIWRPSS